MAVLLGAQQVARTADLQISQGDLEAGAEGGVFLDGGEPLFRDLRQLLLLRIGKKRIGPSAGSAHAAPDLMQLGKTVPIRVFDNQRVGVGHVNARFNDGGGHENVDLALHQIGPDLLQFIPLHPAVGGGHAGIGQGTGDLRRRFIDGFDPILQIEYLSAAAHFPPHSFQKNAVVVLHHVGLYGRAQSGGLLQHAHVHDAAHGHIQGAGNRCSRQGQHVHVGGNLLQLFLLLHAESLFLVHDDQPQIGEGHVLGDQPMSADDDVRISPAKLSQRGGLLGRRAEAGQHIHLHGEAAQTALEGLQMLECQNGGGDEHGYLIAAHDRLEGGTEGHLCFAVSHVAAEETVHRIGRLHIPTDVRNRGALSLRFLVLKGVGKLAAHIVVGVKGNAFGPFPFGVERDQLLGHFLGGGLGLRFGAAPVRPAHLG